MKSAQDLGYDFQDRVQKAIFEIQEFQPAMAHRFVDSKAAGNLISAQPGDHMLLRPGAAWLIEEKHSTIHESLRNGLSSMFKDQQPAQHFKWHRAGHPSLVIFCYQMSMVEFWDGKLVTKKRMEGTRLLKSDQPISRVPLCDLKETLDLITRPRGVL